MPPRGNLTAPDRGQPRSRAPFHALSALLLLVVDNLWNFSDWLVITYLVTVPLSFLSVAVPVFFIQRAKQGDPVGKALLKAGLLGVVAAVPFSVTGTPVGLALLAWAGVKHPGKAS